MLVFEGPDNSGKTTLASYAAHELGIELYHFGKPPLNVKELERRIEFMLDHHDQYIFDRIPLISEPVYSILRDSNMMHLLDKEEVYYSKFRELHPIIIYCRPPIEVMLHGHKAKAHDSKEHMEAVEKNARKLIQRYDEVMGSEYLPDYWQFDYTTQEHDVIISQMRKALEERRQYNQKGLKL